MLPRLTRRVITYGIDAGQAELRARDVVLEGFGSRCTVWRGDRTGRGEPARLGPLRLQVPGRHSVSNALAAVAVGLELDVPFEAIAAALADFKGAERRFQRVGTVAGVTVVDDYGHHPTEIAAVIAAARAANPRAWCWRSSRTATRGLARCSTSSRPRSPRPTRWCSPTSIPPSEDPIPGVTVEALAAAVNARRAAPVHVVPRVADVAAAVAATGAPGRPGAHDGRRLDRRRRDGRGRGAAARLPAQGRGRSDASGRGASRQALPSRPREAFGQAPVAAAAVWVAARAAIGLAVVAYAAWRGAALVASAGSLRVAHVTVFGNQRLSTGEVLSLLDGLRGRHILGIDLGEWQQRLQSSAWVEEATLRRVLPGDGRSARSASAARWPSAGSASALYLVDANGVVVDEYGPTYADLDLPMVDGLGAAGPGRGDDGRPARVAPWRAA